MNLNTLITDVTELGVRIERWGQSGDNVLETIEQELGVRVGKQMRTFVSQYGNLRIPPFSVSVAGDLEQRTGTLVESREVWKSSDYMKAASGLAIMDHAGETYFYFPMTEAVSSFDSMYVSPGEETEKWSSFSEFLDWIVKEAKLFQIRS